MKKETLGDAIRMAIAEAQILEMGMDEIQKDRMMLNAMRLSGAPWSFVERIYDEINDRGLTSSTE